MLLNWLKALHVIFVVVWFAGIFYLPRLFVYHSQADNKASFLLFQKMERRLFIMMTIGAVFTTLLGLSTLLTNPGYYLAESWMQAKLLLVAVLYVYHCWCWVHMQRLRNDSNLHSHKWFRWFNEMPVFTLFAIVILALVKPALF